MPTRQLIAALLSILLLVGGPVESLASVAGTVQNTAVKCDRTVHVETGNVGMNEPNMPAGCNIPQQTTCCLSPAHCASLSVYGIIAWPSLPHLLHATDDIAVPAWTAYQDPIADVLTPPPNLLS